MEHTKTQAVPGMGLNTLDCNADDAIPALPDTVATHATRDVSLDKLDPSPANVRRTSADAGIEELAASIAAHGLLQSLVVRAKRDGRGRATGRFEVAAGGRRRIVTSPHGAVRAEC